MNRRSVFRLVPACACALGLLALAGCGSGKGTVSGTVAYNGKKLTSGTVSVIASDGIQYAAQITTDGKYSIPNVPSGPVKITVSSPNPDDAIRGGPAAARGKGAAAQGDLGGGDQPLPPRDPIPPGSWMAIPEKYSDLEKSGLTGNVRGD